MLLAGTCRLQTTGQGIRDQLDYGLIPTGKCPNIIKGSMVFVMFLIILFQGHGHGGGFRIGRFDIQTQAGLFNCFSSGGSKGGNKCIILFELRKIMKQRLDPGRTEKNKDIVIFRTQVG